MARNRHSRDFRLFALTHTSADADGKISCGLCKQVIGRGFNVEDRFDAFFSHREQHESELNAFVEKPKPRSCVVDHDEIIAKHKGKNAIECARCHQTTWKPLGWVEAAVELQN
jgi:hypothetical protein